MEKNIMLIAVNAKYIHSNPAVFSLKSYAESRGINVNIKEYTINQQSDKVLGDIYLSKPDILCFSCYIWNISFITGLTAEFHQLCPDIPIWLGGPEVSYNSVDFLASNRQITGIIIGEGEESFYRMCSGYVSGKPMISATDGIAWRDECGSIHINEKKSLLSMDDIPFAYGDLTEFENRIIYYESGRGCPFSCSYCLSSVDKCLRLRSLELVYPELQHFLNNKVKQVKFVDRTFNCSHDHALGIWNYIKEHDNGITNFHFEISADLLNEAELTLLNSLRPGLIQLEIGVQTTNAQTLAEIRRSMSLDNIIYSFKRLQSSGNIHLHLDLIAGLPYEDYSSLRQSFDNVYRLKSNQLQLGFLKVLKGSHMHEMADRYGIIYRTSPPYEVLQTKWITYEELLKIKSVEEMLEIHYNSGQFLTSLAILENCFESPFDMYMQLADYYSSKGMTNPGYTRITRTGIFYEFAVSIDSGNAALYREALIHDLYKRERSKARPSFAPDCSGYAKEAKKIMKENGYDHRYCHLEPYHYNVWEIDITKYGAGSITCLETPVWVLYDYEQPGHYFTIH